jgi:putative transposase
MLVVIGATPEGRKELVGFQVGARESAQSWRELLVGLKARGLAMAPELAVGDGALGFWKALEEVFPATRHQRCWVHKAVNVLNKLPKSLQANARQDLREIWLAPDRATAAAAIATFEAKYTPKYERSPAWSRTRRRCSPSMISPPSTGITCVPQTQLRACSPPCGIARCGPKVPCRRRPRG